MGGVGEPDRLGLARLGPVAQTKAWRRTTLGREARESYGRSLTRASSRVRPVLEGLSGVGARALEYRLGDLVTPVQSPLTFLIGQRGLEVSVLPSVEFVDEGERPPGETRDQGLHFRLRRALGRFEVQAGV